jgi:dolichyl-phosphate-mannose-protein mannosyltransferase
LGVFWKITRHKIWFFLLVLNPVILLNAYFWGQVDLLFGGILLMAVVTLIQNKYVYSAIFAGLALSMKSQMLLFIPLFGMIYLLKGDNRKIWRIKSLGILAGVAAFIIPSIPFFFHQNPMISFEPHYTASGRYPYIAMNAMNVWWAIFADYSLKAQLLFPSGETEVLGLISRKSFAFLCFAPIYGIILFWCVKFRKSLSPEFIIKMFALLSISYFMWLPEMHERYSFPFFIFAPAIVLVFKKEWLFYLAFTAIHLFNLVWAWGEQTHFTQEWFFNYGRVIAAIHFILWCAYFYETNKTLASAKTNNQIKLSLGK